MTRLKYHRRTRTAAALGELLELWLTADAEADATLDFTSAEALVPVPLHYTRRWWRGFNQAELLAREVAARVDLPVLPALARIRRTRPQVGLNREQRRRNVAGAFAVDPTIDLAGGYYILIDDVYTTGATLRECARMLKAAGARRVLALTAARRIDDDQPA